MKPSAKFGAEEAGTWLYDASGWRKSLPGPCDRSTRAHPTPAAKPTGAHRLGPGPPAGAKGHWA